MTNSHSLNLSFTSRDTDRGCESFVSYSYSNNLSSTYNEADRKSEMLIKSLLGPREKSTLGEDSIQAPHSSLRETGSDTPSSLHPREEGATKTHSLC